jgi:nitrite reductase (NADH) large subunit
VEKIDRERSVCVVKDVKTGTLSDMKYDAVVLSTGSYPFVPPLKNLNMDVAGAFVYRTIDDLEGMMTFARQSKRAAVIGGGLLGLEAAKAVYDLGQDSHVLEMAPYLMPAQLDEGGGKALQSKITEMGITVHTGSRLQSLVVEGNRVKGVEMTDSEHPEPYVLELDMLVVSAGIRPRAELARECGLAIGPRGGVVVDSRMRSSDPKIFAIGEVASYEGMCYGLIAPGWDQASVLAKNFEDATWGLQKKGKATAVPPTYEGSDLSTKLKLLGVDVASFGSTTDFWFKRQFDDVKGKEQGFTNTIQVDPFSGLYRKLTFDANMKLMGGLLVGNAEDYYSLLNLAGQSTLGNKTPGDLFMGGSGEEGVDDLSDDSVVCLCQKVTKGMIVDAIKNEDACTIPDIKKATTAGNGCGGCVLSTGFIPKILKTTLESMGKVAFTGVSPHFPFTRAELFEIIRVKQLKTYERRLRHRGLLLLFGSSWTAKLCLVGPRGTG